MQTLRFLLCTWLLCHCLVAPANTQTRLELDSGTEPVALLELYSSQGCSSCPPAERWISGLKEDPRLWKQLVPLVFHVDYWDYLGWADPYASSKYSQRQRRYHQLRRSKAVYTPGFMLSGQEWSRWFGLRRLPALPQPQTAEPGRLTVSLQAGNFEARYQPAGAGQGLWLNAAILGFDIVTDIGRGENSGKKLPQDFVVLAHATYRGDGIHWQASLPAVDYTGKKAVAFWISRGAHPAPLQAVGGWLQ